MGKNYNYFIKSVLIGDPGVGKTSLMARIMKEDYKDNYTATIYIDFKTRNFEVGGEKIKFDIWDTAG